MESTGGGHRAEGMGLEAQQGKTGRSGLAEHLEGGRAGDLYTPKAFKGLGGRITLPLYLCLIPGSLPTSLMQPRTLPSMPLHHRDFQMGSGGSQEEVDSAVWA